MHIQDSPFARKLAAFVALSPEEIGALSEIYKRRRKFPVGGDMVYQGQRISWPTSSARAGCVPTNFCPADRGRSSISRSLATFWGCGRSFSEQPI